MKTTDSDSNRFNLHIPTVTIIKLCATALLLFLITRLAPLLALLVVSLILAVSMQPVIKRCEKWVPRWLAISCVGILSLAVLLSICFGVFPPLATQISSVVTKAPAYLQKNLQHISHGPQFYTYIESHLKTGVSEHAASWFQSLMDMGQMAIESLSSVLLVYVFFLYLLVDGPRAWAWFIAFFNTKNKAKIEETSQQVSTVISAYVLGQLITSVLAAIYVFIALQILNVPAALMLAVIAGIFDALPVLGFFLSLIPAVIFALTVSPNTALIVVALYVLYHAIENYVLLPYVYGNRLRMSGLVVLLSFLAAGIVGGLIGALVILPIVASYPIIEKIWLADYLGPKVLAEHRDDEA